MEYSLAKKLKEAGFAQKYPTGSHNAKGQRYWMHDPSDDDYTEIVHDGHGYNALDDIRLTLIPTLEELIEACGDRLFRLRRFKDGVWAADITDAAIELIGHSPTDVVALLWLTLNKVK